jgi:hypothetical protein
MTLPRKPGGKEEPHWKGVLAKIDTKGKTSGAGHRAKQAHDAVEPILVEEHISRAKQIQQTAALSTPQLLRVVHAQTQFTGTLPPLSLLFLPSLKPTVLRGGNG